MFQFAVPFAFALLLGPAFAQAAQAFIPTTPVAHIQNVEFSSGALLSPFESGRHSYEVSSLNTLARIRVRVTGTPNSYCYLQGRRVSTNTWAWLKLGRLDAHTTINVTSDPSDHPALRYTFATLPADLPAYQVRTGPSAPSEILLSPQPTRPGLPPYLLMLDERGRVLFYRRMNRVVSTFTRFVLPGGQIRYAYHDQEAASLPGSTYQAGQVHVLDEAFDEVARLELSPAHGRPALPAEQHDFLLLGDNHYLLSAYYGKTVTNVPGREGEPTPVIASVLQEVENGRVVFDWDSSDHPEFYATSLEGNDYAGALAAGRWADYMHFNSVFVDPRDGNFVVSFRHQDAVVKIERASGKVLWRLGGPGDEFHLAGDERFSRQHDASVLGDGQLLLFDNGTAQRATRLLLFGLDEGDKRVVSFQSVALPGRFTEFTGSVQQLAPGVLFVGWGFHHDGGPDASQIDAASGQESFWLKFSDAYFSYRALKYPR